MYILHQIQNKLIESCSDVSKSKIIEEVKYALAFLRLADETADISDIYRAIIHVVIRMIKLRFFAFFVKISVYAT